MTQVGNKVVVKNTLGRLFLYWYGGWKSRHDPNWADF